MACMTRGPRVCLGSHVSGRSVAVWRCGTAVASESSTAPDAHTAHQIGRSQRRGRNGHLCSVPWGHLVSVSVRGSQVVRFLRIEPLTNTAVWRGLERISAVSNDSLAGYKHWHRISTRRRRCSSVAVSFFAPYAYSAFPIKSSIFLKILEKNNSYSLISTNPGLKLREQS
jgi:hypothetical protein